MCARGRGVGLSVLGSRVPGRACSAEEEGEKGERKREGERFAATIATGGRAWATSDRVTRDGTAVSKKREKGSVGGNKKRTDGHVEWNQVLENGCLGQEKVSGN